MYPHTKNELSGSTLSKVGVLQERQTDKQMRPNQTYTTVAFAGGKKVSVTVQSNQPWFRVLGHSHFQL